MIDVTVKVPEERVGEFYELVGRWLSGDQHLAGPDLAGTSDSSAKGWRNTDDDVPLAREVWGKLSSHARALFVRLMDSPGQKMSGEDLAEELGIPNGKYGIAGVLAWPGRHCAAVKRLPLWNWEDGPVGGSADYWVDQEVADLFERIR
jgi:hypothetical protein